MTTTKRTFVGVVKNGRIEVLLNRRPDGILAPVEPKPETPESPPPPAAPEAAPAGDS
jgi:hypothetical protein